MSLLKELQRRKVIRAAAVYLVASWLLLQVAATIASIVTLPEWFEELVLALLVIGLPIALLLAWSLELTPDGLGAETATESSRGNRVVDYSILGALAIALIWFAFSRLAPETTQSSAPLDKSVAVLPFANLSGDEANAAFTSGIHADLLTQLSRINTVRTVSRTTVLRFGDSSKSIGEIAKELGVATIVEWARQHCQRNFQVTPTSCCSPLAGYSVTWPGCWFGACSNQGATGIKSCKYRCGAGKKGQTNLTGLELYVRLL